MFPCSHELACFTERERTCISSLCKVENCMLCNIMSLNVQRSRDGRGKVRIINTSRNERKREVRMTDLLQGMSSALVPGKIVSLCVIIPFPLFRDNTQLSLLFPFWLLLPFSLLTFSSSLFSLPLVRGDLLSDHVSRSCIKEVCVSVCVNQGKI